METTTPKTTKEGQAAFVPIPDLDKMAVGHAGLYPVDDVSSIEEIEVVVENDIPLGIKGGKTLIDCEKGIKAFVKDVLAKDKTNHLPNTETGVWVHYLTEGIARDFNRTWETTPVSIREKQSYTEKARTQGKRGLSKKEKNELLAKLTYQFYESDVNDGLISQQEAFASMAEAAAKKKELEDAGYFLSPNKTQGVALFDWKSAVIEAHGKDTATKIYTKNKVAIIIPNLVENFYKSNSKPKKLAKDLSKTPLAFTAGVAEQIYTSTGQGASGGAELKEINSEADLYHYLKENNKFSSTISKIDNEFNIKGFHLTKITASGMMKPRQICIDCISKKDGSQHLFLLDGEGGITHIK